MNAKGQIILRRTNESKIETINTESLSSGIYLLRVKSERELINKVIVKN